MDKGKHKMDQNGTSPSILPGPLIHSIMDSNDHTHVVGVQLVSLGSGWSIELLLWRVPDVQKQWLGKATNDSMGARPDSVKNASNHKRRKHANVCCKCMPTCICYTYTYALHTHTHTYIYIYTETAFLGIHMTKPLCKTVSKKKYIYIKQKQYYMQIWQLWFLIWRLRRDKAAKWQKIGTVCLGTAEEPKHSPMTQLVGVENSHPNPLKSPLQVPLMVCHHPPRPSKYW